MVYSLQSLAPLLNYHQFQLDYMLAEIEEINHKNIDYRYKLLYRSVNIIRCYVRCAQLKQQVIYILQAAAELY